MIKQVDFENIEQTSESFSKDASKEIDNTVIHMKRITLDIQDGNQCDYRYLNLKQETSVHPQNENSQVNDTQFEALLDQNNKTEYFTNVTIENFPSLQIENIPNNTNLGNLSKSSTIKKQKTTNRQMSQEISNEIVKNCRSNFSKFEPEEQINYEGKNSNSETSLPYIQQNSGKNKLSINNNVIEFFEKEDLQQQTVEKVPVRLMKAIYLLVNVKGFYRQLTKNSRIFEKLTFKQHRLIGDQTAIYKKQYGKNVISILNNRYVSKIILVVYSFQQLMRYLFQNIKLFEPNNMAKRMWDTIQAILIIYLIYIISLVIFFSLKIDLNRSTFSTGLILFIVDMIFTFNTAIIEKGNSIKQRSKIALTYFKRNFIFDFLGLIPLLITQFELNPHNDIYKMMGYGFIVFKIFLLKDILDSLSFFFSFEKNRKNLVDLFKVIFLIISVCHVFSILWHGLALYEMTVLQRDDTWINNQNLVDADVYIRYIYSFYYLAVTMQTVGYGDITPKNPIEIMFTVITMFCTGMIWAFSLNSIGNIIENINKVNKDYKDDMELIHCFMREEAVESELRVKVSNYLEYLHKESNETKRKRENEIIHKLSKQLQQDLACEVQGNFLKGIPLIRDFVSQKAQLSLIPLMEEILFSPGEIIFKQQEVDDSAIYYIVKGSVQLFFVNQNNEKKDHLIQELYKKQYFGEISFLTGQVRGASARASDFCRLFKIKRDDFLQVIKNNPNDQENFQMVREAVSLKNNLKFASIRCYQCNQGDHLSIKCPKTQLTLTKQIIIRKHNFSEPIKERTFQKRRDNSSYFKTRLQINQIQEVIYYMLNNPKHQQHLIELEKNFLKQGEDDQDDENDAVSECSSQQSNSESQSSSSKSQQSMQSSLQSEQESVGTLVTINKINKIQNNNRRKSSIFANQQQSSNKIGSFLEQKPFQLLERLSQNITSPKKSKQTTDSMDQESEFNLNNMKKSSSCIVDSQRIYIDQKPYHIKENLAAHNLSPNLHKQFESEFDQQTNQLNPIRSIIILEGSQTSIKPESQQIQFNDIKKRPSSQRKQSCQKAEEIQLCQGVQSYLNLNDEVLNQENKKKVPSISLIQDKYRQSTSLQSKNKEKKAGSQMNISMSLKERKQNKENSLQPKSKLNTNKKQNKKSLAFSQIQNLITFQQNNNIIPAHNLEELQPRNANNNLNMSANQGFQNCMSLGSTNYNKILTYQITQMDQRNANLISIEEMNKRFDKLKNFQIYNPHNNSTEVLRQYDEITEKHINNLLSKMIYKFRNTNRKLPKKVIPPKNFIKDISTPFSGVQGKLKNIIDKEFIQSATKQHLFKRQGYSLKDVCAFQ